MYTTFTLFTSKHKNYETLYAMCIAYSSAKWLERQVSFSSGNVFCWALNTLITILFTTPTVKTWNLGLLPKNYN